MCIEANMKYYCLSEFIEGFFFFFFLQNLNSQLTKMKTNS